jgi:hypothetical protein
MVYGYVRFELLPAPSLYILKAISESAAEFEKWTPITGHF